VLKGLGAWEYAGIIGNGYSFAHAKYGANPWVQHIFRDQNTFWNCWENCWGRSALRATTVGSYMYNIIYIYIYIYICIYIVI
jgi:hypothetical protein